MWRGWSVVLVLAHLNSWAAVMSVLKKAYKKIQGDAADPIPVALIVDETALSALDSLFTSAELLAAGFIGACCSTAQAHTHTPA